MDKCNCMESGSVNGTIEIGPVGACNLETALAESGGTISINDASIEVDAETYREMHAWATGDGPATERVAEAFRRLNAEPQRKD